MDPGTLLGSALSLVREELAVAIEFALILAAAVAAILLGWRLMLAVALSGIFDADNRRNARQDRADRRRRRA